jgi:hypothetical protein
LGLRNDKVRLIPSERDTLFFFDLSGGLKGQNMTAQGNALGIHRKNQSLIFERSEASFVSIISCRDPPHDFRIK